MAGIFLSYRRADSNDVVGRIYDRLIQRFPRCDVFRDFDSLRPGLPFPQQLDDAITRSTVSLVLIGPQWVSVTNQRGYRRLDDPSDFVRLEVERSLGTGIPVIPVLVSNAIMPDGDALPESLKPLVLLHGIRIRPDP